ncbi:3-dehydroquinate synthase [Brackiella oedipodis]|uniref:3-dehydroquinate synthase n=1 Tax=Brackiella oedipodis TaxID=124225 RepID=UPI0004920CE0|nr:3-dehydroquinate synthase [Brackiella oedipodis]
MSLVRVHTPSGQYPIHIEQGNLPNLAQLVPSNTSAIILISNPTVYDLYGATVEQALQAIQKPLYSLQIPDGEQYKSLATLETVYQFMLEKQLDRHAVLVALGGGVVGDLSGFAAATYMRGIRFIQVPTTLLAQVDSSVGGKTAVNHPLGKNMIGAFYQPIAVHIDTAVLKSLPDREIAAGLAEVIKYGMILDAGFFRWCIRNVQLLRQLDREAIIYAVKRSCEIKADVVSKDEKEAGMRAFLNFGHTFGHAIETGLGYGAWLHGEAVGCGMVQAAELSHLVFGLSRNNVEEIRDLVAAIGCPTLAPNLGNERWLALMMHDKKTLNQKLKFILLEAIGQAKITEVPKEALLDVLNRTVCTA